MKLKQLHELYQRQTGLSKVNTQHFLEMELLRSAPAIIELYEAAKCNYECRDDPRRDLRLEAALKALEQ